MLHNVGNGFGKHGYPLGRNRSGFIYQKICIVPYKLTYFRHISFTTVCIGSFSLSKMEIFNYRLEVESRSHCCQLYHFFNQNCNERVAAGHKQFPVGVKPRLLA